MPETNFFTEEATRQILLRVANVFNDPDLCDAIFIVGEGEKKEEIAAPSQFMAVSSSYFKEMFYPLKPDDDKKREIQNMLPQIFRKILDYLFRGKVPLTSIEDAWKVKVAGRQFCLRELEDLCTKFLKYRLDSQNLLVYLKNSCKYECPDLREVIINRFLKEAMAVLDDSAFLDLSEEELISLIEKEPEVQAKKLMSVLIKWAMKRLNIEEPSSDQPAEKKMKLENGEATTEESKVDAKEESKMDTTESGDTDKDKVAKEDKGEKSKEETKGEPEKPKESEKPKEPEKPNLIKSLQPFIKYITWDHGDAEYFLKEVHQNNVMTEEDENKAMSQMLQSYVEMGPTQPAKAQVGKKTPPSRTSGRNRGGRQAPERTSSGGPDCAVVMEKISRTPGSGGYIVDKTDEDMILS